MVTKHITTIILTVYCSVYATVCYLAFCKYNKSNKKTKRDTQCQTVMLHIKPEKSTETLERKDLFVVEFNF